MAKIKENANVDVIYEWIFKPNLAIQDCYGTGKTGNLNVHISRLETVKLHRTTQRIENSPPTHGIFCSFRSSGIYLSGGRILLQTFGLCSKYSLAEHSSIRGRSYSTMLQSMGYCSLIVCLHCPTARQIPIKWVQNPRGICAGICMCNMNTYT